MSDTDNAGTETNPGNEKDQGTQDRNWRQLEDKANTATSEANKWRTTAIEMAARSAGYDVSKGVTKTLIEKFDSEVVDADAFKKFATEQGLEPHSVVKDATDQDKITETLDQTNANQDKVTGDLQQGDRKEPTAKELMDQAQKENRPLDALGLALHQDVVEHFSIGKQQAQG